MLEIGFIFVSKNDNIAKNNNKTYVGENIREKSTRFHPLGNDAGHWAGDGWHVVVILQSTG
jgi:hypothetical protein